MTGQDLTLQVGRRTVTATVVGPEDGAPAVFFHGSPGCRLQALRLESSARAAGVRLIAIDRPGCGGCPPASGDPAEQMVQDLAAALDELEMDAAPAIALSGGVAAVLTAATSLPQRIERIVIACGLGLLTSQEHMEGASILNKVLCVLARRGPVAARLALALPYVFSRLTPTSPAFTGDDDRARALMQEMRETFRQGVRGPASDLSAASRVELVDLEAVGQPVTAWHGSTDRHAPLPAMQALIERLPDATLHVVEGADHFLFEWHADLILAELSSPG